MRKSNQVTQKDSDQRNRIRLGYLKSIGRNILTKSLKAKPLRVHSRASWQEKPCHRQKQVPFFFFASTISRAIDGCCAKAVGSGVPCQRAARPLDCKQLMGKSMANQKVYLS